MSAPMRCLECMFNSMCAHRNESTPVEEQTCVFENFPKLPYCFACDYSKKHVDEITGKVSYFCIRLGTPTPVRTLDFCSRGKPRVARDEPKAEPQMAEASAKTNEIQDATSTTPNPARKHVDIYTDGACKGNPGPGGWGAIIVYASKEKELGGNDPSTTNNRMELMAVISALSTLKEPCTVKVTTDSRYVCDAITKGWAKNWRAKGWKKANGDPALNPDLWDQMLNLLEKHEVTLEWIKGHDGHPYNERCDKIACAEAEKAK